MLRGGCQTLADPCATSPAPPLHDAEIVPGLIKENRRFMQKPCELTASTTLSRVKCCICILMGCYRVINAPVRMHYPKSELKGSLPNRLSLQKRAFLWDFFYFFMLMTLLFCTPLPLAPIMEEIQKDPLFA